MLIHQIKKGVAYVGKNKGKTVYYAAPIVQDKVTSHQVENRIIKATALSRADVRSAITALAEIVREEMLAGRAVALADLGSFRIVSLKWRCAIWLRAYSALCYAPARPCPQPRTRSHWVEPHTL